MDPLKFNRILSRVVIFMLFVGCSSPRSTIPSLAENTVIPTQTISPSPAPIHAPTTSPTTTAVPTYTPTPTDMPLTATAISLGNGFTCALTNRGGVRCWGINYQGQLGDGTTTNRIAPVDVVGLTSAVKTIVAGDHHTCALTNSGGVKCWGSNDSGQLGDGSGEAWLSPGEVLGLGSGVQAISAGWEHTCALLKNGGIKCWGGNYYGQLGDGTTTTRLTPAYVVGLTSGVKALAAGLDYTCALLTNGGVKCWGHNYSGERADGAMEQRLTPVNVEGLTSGVLAISAGDYHTCALLTDGGVKCWGSNLLSWYGCESDRHIVEGGQLGDGTTEDRLTPVQVMGLTTGATAIAAGRAYTCALMANGGVKCWGSNGSGQLGDGTTELRLSPVKVAGLTSGVASIDTGTDHTCAVMTSGKVMCWGSNEIGQLGDRSGEAWRVPGEVVGLKSGVTAIDAGESYTCVLISEGAVKCWGDGRWGDNTSMVTPVDLEGFTSGVTSFSMSDYGYLTCVVSTNSGVICWNYYSFHHDHINILASDVTSLSVGLSHACALMKSGAVKCWGNNDYGQLGDGTTTYRSTPVDVVGLTGGVSAISTVWSHTCALLTNGGVKCWGSNGNGALGDGTTEQRLTPVDVVGLTSGVSAISTSTSHTCALLTNGGVKCWGRNFSGQLGDGTTQQRLTPVDVVGLTSPVVAIDTCSVYGGHTCAILVNGGVKCWGWNYYGQLGDGTTEQRLTPVDVLGLPSEVTAIAVGAQHTCALINEGGVVCWGSNSHGTLGRGTSAIQVTPVDVVGFGL